MGGQHAWGRHAGGDMHGGGASNGAWKTSASVHGVSVCAWCFLTWLFPPQRMMRGPVSKELKRRMRPWYCGVGRMEADMLSGSLERPRKEGGTWMEVALAVLPMATESSGVDGRRLAAALIAGGGNASRRRSVWSTRSKCIHILKEGMQPQMQLRLCLQCQQQLNSCRAKARRSRPLLSVSHFKRPRPLAHHLPAQSHRLEPSGRSTGQLKQLEARSCICQ